MANRSHVGICATRILIQDRNSPYVAATYIINIGQDLNPGRL